MGLFNEKELIRTCNTQIGFIDNKQNETSKYTVIENWLIDHFSEDLVQIEQHAPWEIIFAQSSSMPHGKLYLLNLVIIVSKIILSYWAGSN